MADETTKNSGFSEKEQEESASTVVQLITKLVKVGYDWAKNKFEWEKAANAYVKHWIDRWGQVQPLGADSPIPLHQIYVQVHAVPRSFLQRFASVDDMEASLRRTSSRSLFALSEQEKAIYQPQSGLRIANHYSRLNVLGAPGAGKSTFLRRVGFEALRPRTDLGMVGGASHYRSEYEFPLLPVLIELRSIRNASCSKKEDVVALLAQEFAISGFPEADKFVLEALQRGGLLVLFDGVDEIPANNLSSSVKAIRDFIHRYRDCRYIISCRTAFYKDWFAGFHDFVLADFDDEQISEFAKNWFSRKEEYDANAAGHFVALLKSPDHRATRELAGSPLLLTFLCLVFRKTQQFPANRAQLYQKAVRIYLEEWNAHKLIHQQRVYEDLTPEIEVELLKDIAGPTFIENRLFFSGDELRAYISVFLHNELNAPKSLSPSQILTAIAVQQGLFVERAQDVWSFSHLSIQEYLAAAWMLEEGQANEIIGRHAHENRWREIFLLMSGLTRADGVLAVMTDCTDATSFGKDSLNTLFTALASAAEAAWDAIETNQAENVFERSRPRCAQAFLRSVALFLGCIGAGMGYHQRREDFTVDIAVETALAIDAAVGLNMEIQLRSALHRGRSATLTPDLYLVLDLDVVRFFRLDLVRPIALALNELMRTKDQSLLVQHCRLSKLMCDCKRAALRISLQGWEAACSRMLNCGAMS